MAKSSAPVAAILATGDPRESALAAELGLPLVVDPGNLPEAILSFRAGKLTLSHATHPEFKEFHADFASARDLERLKQGFASDPLRKAFGKSVRGSVVWDFTLGLGRDAFDMARMGALVYAWERSPVVYALWSDARTRALAHPELASVFARIHGFLGESAKLHADLSEGKIPPPDHVYLDPMYPEEGGASAKRKKEMVLLREIVGADPDARRLFDVAKEAGPKRVIVKRPAKAEAFAEPGLVVKGKSHRFDVYIRGVNF